MINRKRLNLKTPLAIFLERNQIAKRSKYALAYDVIIEETKPSKKLSKMRSMRRSWNNNLENPKSYQKNKRGS